MRIRDILAIAALVAAGALGATPAPAQDHTISAGSVSAVPGQTVTVSILLDNDEPVRGFSLGLAHSGAIVTLTSIVPGAALLAANGGAGPDFFIEETAPANGPGGTCGAILSFSPPLEDIPIGSGSELAEFTYTASPAAPPASASPLVFSNTLGSPPIETIVSIAGVTRIPITVNGSIAIVTAPVTGLSCSLSDPCACAFALTWTNQGVYDSIRVLQDGVLVQTLGGGATSTVVNTISTTSGGPAANSLQVIARRNGNDSAPASCLATCPNVPDPIAPTAFTCTVDPFTGVATLSWTNSQPYDQISVSIDGVPTASLSGAASTTTLPLAAPGTYTICLDGGDFCHVPFASACCTAVYPQIFVRGDMNSDGSFNISDPVYGLNYLFTAGTVPCVKAVDVNDSGTVDLADVVVSLNAIFGLGGLPPSPFPLCGVDPTADILGCESFPSCP